MGDNMKVIGLKITWMVMEPIHGKMVDRTKGSIRMIRNMEMVPILVRMEVSI